MTKINTIENKISSIQRYLKILRGYQKLTQKQILGNVDITGATERYLYLACQSTIDLAESFVSFKNFRKPSVMSESFYILEEENIIDKKLMGALVKMVGFRNILAHDYGKLNYDILYDVLTIGVKDIERFLKKIEKEI